MREANQFWRHPCFGGLSLFEARFRRKDGRQLDYHLSADLIEVRGRPISVRRRAIRPSIIAT